VKNRFFITLSFALAIAPASVALAAWSPLLPGWTVHEVPVAITSTIADDALGTMAIDPVSGDFFVVGTTTAGGAISLLRLSQSGQVINLGPCRATAPGRPAFDAVHRVVFVRSSSLLLRFGENGARLSSIAAPPSGPFEAGPDGELYAVSYSASSPSGLQLMRYDTALAAWIALRDVPLTAGAPGLQNQVPDQLTFDESGRPFATLGGQIFRIDDDATVSLGYSLLKAQLAVGGDMALFGEGLFDPDDPGFAQGFASRPTGHALFGVALAPGPTVLFLDSSTSGVFALDVFTLGPTPSAKRSWGALKSLGR
jgi:hypothetical protein